MPRHVEAPRATVAGFACLAAANAAAVASLYWNQTLIHAVTASFPQQASLLSLVPLMTLLGYGSGVALIAFGPDLRFLTIPRHLALLAIALTAASLATSVPALAGASYVVGLGAAAAQRLLAAAARLGGSRSAGTAIGFVLSAALLAVLGVRLLGDTFAAAFGWRSAFLLAAGCVAGSAAAGWLAQALPEPPTPRGRGLGVVAALWQRSGLLRAAALQQMMLFTAYGAGWMTALAEVPPEERSLVVIGGSGIGLCAALAGGRLVDRFREVDIPRAAACIIVLAAGVLLPCAYAMGPGLARVLLLLPGMALLDGGLQLALVANQTRAQAIDPAARTRLAALLTVCGSIGGGVGAGGATRLWQMTGWSGAITLTACAGALGLACSFISRRARASSPAAGRPDPDPSSNQMPLRENPAAHDADYAANPQP